ncbi:MAG: CocE/NonD family hydrolase [Phenylobacterium sp.]
MKIVKWATLLCVSLLAACSSGDAGGGEPVSQGPVVAASEFRRAVAGHRVTEVKVPGADGARLSTYVYLPAQGAGPFPTLVMRTPYDLPITPVSGFPEEHANGEIEVRPEDVGWTEATDRGYALVVQVTRGRLSSDGVFSLFLGDEVGDGEALIRWVERQPWSNGRIGVFGDSASGVVSRQAAASGRASIKAVFAQVTSPDFVGGVLFPEGRAKWEALLPFLLSQVFDNSEDHDSRLGLTAQQIGALKGQAGDALEEMFGALEAGDPAQSSWWTRPITPDFPIVSQLYPRWPDLLAAGRSPAAGLDVTDRIRAPVLHVSMWHDFFQDSTLKSFGRMQAARGDQKLIVLDGTHYEIDDPDLWPIKPMFLWFDHYLKGEANGVPGWPTVQYQLAGQPEGPLRSSPVWPLSGAASTVFTLAAPQRAMIVNPASPTPTLGGNHQQAPAGMLDQRPLLDRANVVELKGGALPAGRLLRRSAEVELTVLQAGAGDIVVKLVDRRPDGEVRLLRESVVALRGAGTQRVTFGPLAYAFDAGSSPGLVVAGASLPAYRSFAPPLSGSVLLGSARLQLPLATP